jgi:DNA-directed RNA polymerase specialized sigma24 family protein
VKADSRFERFYERESHAVFSSVFLLCRNRAVAEDATQEAFARAFERWDRLGSQPWRNLSTILRQLPGRIY